jgi:spore coat protein H
MIQGSIPKKSLKIKFNDEPFLNGKDKINFNAEYTDPTYMRQFLSSYLFRQAGHPCFKAEHARLYLNGEYFGIYLMVENMDADFLKANDLDPVGNLYKATHDGACLSIFDAVYEAWEKKTSEHQNRDDLQELIDSLEYVPENEYYEFCKERFRL